MCQEKDTVIPLPQTHWLGPLFCLLRPVLLTEEMKPLRTPCEGGPSFSVPSGSSVWVLCPLPHLDTHKSDWPSRLAGQQPLPQLSQLEVLTGPLNSSSFLAGSFCLALELVFVITPLGDDSLLKAPVWILFDSFCTFSVSQRSMKYLLCKLICL